MNDNNGNREYIKGLFDDDGIKAPESLSEENMLMMLEAEDAKAGAAAPDADKSSAWGKAAQERKGVKPRKFAKRFMGVAAALLVAVIGISGVYSVMTTAPDTSEVNGELYTFKSDREIKRMVRSMDSVSFRDYFMRKDYEVLEEYDYSTDTETFREGEAFESNGAVESAEPKAISNSNASGKAPSHSDTYLQVEDVDEADIVKTDGKYIYYVNSKKEVVILSAKDGKTEKVGTIGAGSIDNYVQDIYLKGDTLVTVGKFYTGDDEGSSGISIYDISDRSDPSLVSFFKQSGEIVTSRMVGDFAYIVTEDYIYSGDRYLPMCGFGDSYTRLSPTDISCVPTPRSCSYIVLSAVDVTSGKQGKSASKAVFGATDEIYCNDHNLYSVSSEWGNNTDTEYTRIARASLDGLNIRFNGTATVRGYIVNRFAMDEADGYFRIATTSMRNGIDVNNLYVLDSSLKEAGKVTGFARNESIKAVRYMGTKAYVITYEAIDPLFIIDLADPKDPRIEGEVKIDGFSTLLVPAGEGRLIGIGHATGDNGYGGEYDSGLKLVLFDISDPSRPKALDSKEYENMTSPAQSDSRALTVNSEAGWYAIPYGIDNYDDFGMIVEDDIIEDAEVPEETEESYVTEPQNEYEAGVLVFRADDKLSSVDQHKLGNEYLARNVYIGDYIYALDRDGNCTSFKPNI